MNQENFPPLKSKIMLKFEKHCQTQLSHLNCKGQIMNEKVCRLVEVGVGRWNSQHCIWEVQLVIITTKPEMEAGGVQVWMPA